MPGRRRFSVPPPTADPGRRPRGIGRTQYLVDGQNIEVLWYSPTGERWTAADTVPESRVLPVVLIDSKVIGVGRDANDRAAELHRLPKNGY